MLDIAEVIRNLVGGASPNRALLDANGALPPTGDPQASAAPSMPPIPTAPVGATTPVTNPASSTDIPKVMQSPPDLANMYVELMKRNQNAQQLDSGMNMIAAGFSKYPENRAALISAGGRGTGMSLSGSDIVNMQKQQTEMRDRLTRQTLLGGLAKQYNMTPAQVQYLESSGKLDEVIKHYSTENLAQIKDENGRTHFAAPRTGKIIATIGSEKEDPTEYVTGPNGPELRNKYTGARIGDPVGAKTETQFVAGPNGQELRNKATNELIGMPVGLVPDGQVIARPDGSQFIVDKNDPSKPIRELTDKERIGDKIIPQQNELEAINVARKARGEDPLTAEQLIKMKQTPPTNINVGTDGSAFPAPEKGFDYERTSDGKVKIHDNGRPKLYRIEGGGPEQDAKDAAKKLSDEELKKAKTKVQASFAASNVGIAVDEALKHVDTPGVVGIGSKAMRGMPSPGGLPHDKFDAAMSTISANTAFEALRQMRASSPTGGALGQVSDFENKMLRDTIAPLATYQDPKTMRSGLNRIKAAMEILAEDNFGNDAAKFKTALDKRVEELGNVSSTNKIRKLN